MGVIVPNFASSTEDRTSGAQVIDGGLRFDSGKSHYLNRTPGSAGNRKTWTWSGWVKRSALDSNQLLFGSSTLWTELFFNSSNQLQVYAEGGSLPGGGVYLYSNAVFRDTSAWMHVVWVLDTTQSTASDRLRVYVNGQQITWTSSISFGQNVDFNVNSTSVHGIGMRIAENNLKLNAYLANIYFIDGQALDASYFGYTDPLTNTWRPKKFKPTGPNDGTVWSNSLTAPGSGFGGSIPATNAFDGNLSTLAGTNNSTSANLLFTKTFTNVTRLRVFADHSTGYRMRVNGGTWYSDSTLGASANASWRDLTSIIPAGGTITSIEADTNGANNGVNWAAIEVNGVILLDSDTTNIGKNGFYLPFDGNTPIGQDQSGRGNNWTPVNFGGSNTIEKATGALPILNTDGGGKVARVGVRTDSNASSLVLALPLVGNKSDFSNAINSGTSNKTITANGNAAASNSQSNFYGGSFYFDGTGDWLSIGTSSDLSIGTSDNFTFEAFIYPTAVSDTTPFGIGNNAGFAYRIISGSPYLYIGAVGGILTTGTISANKWTHIAVTRNSGTLYSFIDGVLVGSVANTSSFSGTQENFVGAANLTGAGSPGYTFTGYIQDVRFYKGLAKYTQNFIPASTDPDILPDTPSGVAYSSNVALVPSTDGAVAFDGSTSYLTLSSSSDFTFGTNNYTIECFVYYNSTSSGYVYDFRSGDANAPALSISSGTLYAGGAGNNMTVSNIATGKWYHIALVRNSNTETIYIDGVAYNTQSNANNLAQTALTIGRRYAATFYYHSGIISNLHIVNGTALYTSNFTPPTAPITSVANTKLLCCKSNSSATAFDVSPGTITANGNAAATNFNPFTVNINAVRGQESGYATLNPLRSGMTLSNGNLKATSSSTYAACTSTIGISTGKFYYETLIEDTGGTAAAIGVGTKDTVPTTYLGAGTYDFCYNNTIIYGNNTNLQTGLPSLATGDTVGVAMNLDNSVTTFYKNGILITTQSMTSGIEYYPALGDNSSGGQPILSANFGQKPFKFPPPAGFQPLALANTPRPTIVRPDQYVGVTTYTGNTPSSQSINVGWKPDFVWLKVRNAGDAHQIYDSVRGATKYLHSSSPVGTNAEATDANALTAFTSTGFTVGSTGGVNSNNMVAWCWKAGGNSNTYNINDIGYSTASAAGLTAGNSSITGASVNTKSGFSIITYTGNASNRTIPHGLGRAPKFWIYKRRDTTANWPVNHTIFDSMRYLYLNLTNQQQDNSASYWGNLPTSDVLYIGNDTDTNALNGTYVLYLWAEIPGFSKFGSYTGNNSTDGVYVSLGFRPKFLIVKCIQDIAGDVEHWIIRDSTRSTYNPANANLYANLSNAEDDASGFSGSLDLLSNGFKMRGTYGGINASATYIYAAWAEAPSFNLYGGQANAR